MGILRVMRQSTKKVTPTSLQQHFTAVDRCSLKMSTRSRRKAGLASKTESEPLTAAKAKVRSHGARSAQADDMDVEPHSINGKENLKSSAIKQGKKDRSKKKLLDLDCVCSKGNDGSPMVYCASCRIWCVLVFFYSLAFHAGDDI